ncbi:unnamed protein product [Amoebophrya sp. A25]|nr:unnamed protein product [Amoebophrya sp. A25]|eukprot:GSA25T00009019001.1
MVVLTNPVASWSKTRALGTKAASEADSVEAKEKADSVEKAEKERKDHAQMKENKNQREVEYFQQLQHQSAGAPPTIDYLDENEVFAGVTGETGVDFSNYDNLEVDIQGVGREQVEAMAAGAVSFNDMARIHQFPDFLSINLSQRCKYRAPTPVQKWMIPVGMMERDAMACAQTGSGKTCAFLIPIVAMFGNENLRCFALGKSWEGPAAPRALILAPTRELCSQTFNEARKLCFGQSIRVNQCYGGVDAKPQIRDFARGCDICIATPGRLNDFVDRGIIQMTQCMKLVLDEADRMLDMGFEPQIKEIVHGRGMPPKEMRQTLLFSATFESQIRILGARYMKPDKIDVTIGRVGAAAETVEQHFIAVESEEKKQEEMYNEIARCENGTDKVLVFVNTKKKAASIVHTLHESGECRATAIHGDLNQNEREDALANFKSGRKPVLVATEVAARGLDIPKVAKVINYDMPKQIDGYIHRIGRTGRVGNRGIAVSFFATHGSEEPDCNIAADLLQTLTDQGLNPDLEAPWLREQISYARDADKGNRRGGGGGKKGGGGFGGKGKFGGSNFGGKGDTFKPAPFPGGKGGIKENMAPFPSNGNFAPGGWS